LSLKISRKNPNTVFIPESLSLCIPDENRKLPPAKIMNTDSKEDCGRFFNSDECIALHFNTIKEESYLKLESFTIKCGQDSIIVPPIFFHKRSDVMTWGD
jgi:hypothetical protein